MSVTMDSPIHVGGGVWEFRWSSDLAAPTFWLYRNGVLLGTTTNTSTRLRVVAGQTVAFEVFDAQPARTPIQFPGEIILQWRAVADAVHYRVEEDVATVWTLRATILEDGSGLYDWQSGPLDDVTSYDFRVRAVDAHAMQGTALALSVFMVRYPDVPAFTSAYDSGTNKVTVTVT